MTKLTNTFVDGENFIGRLNPASIGAASIEKSIAQKDFEALYGNTDYQVFNITSMAGFLKGAVDSVKESIEKGDVEQKTADERIQEIIKGELSDLERFTVIAEDGQEALFWVRKNQEA